MTFQKDRSVRQQWLEYTPFWKLQLTSLTSLKKIYSTNENDKNTHTCVYIWLLCVDEVVNYYTLTVIINHVQNLKHYTRLVNLFRLPLYVWIMRGLVQWFPNFLGSRRPWWPWDFFPTAPKSENTYQLRYVSAVRNIPRRPCELAVGVSTLGNAVLIDLV